ncbi:hypothetical protein AAVH_32292, partial [Aphelenchoides avenae]
MTKRRRSSSVQGNANAIANSQRGVTKESLLQRKKRLNMMMRKNLVKACGEINRGMSYSFLRNLRTPAPPGSSSHSTATQPGGFNIFMKFLKPKPVVLDLDDEESRSEAGMTAEGTPSTPEKLPTARTVKCATESPCESKSGSSSALNAIDDADEVVCVDEWTPSTSGRGNKKSPEGRTLREIAQEKDEPTASASTSGNDQPTEQSVSSDDDVEFLEEVINSTTPAKPKASRRSASKGKGRPMLPWSKDYSDST